MVTNCSHLKVENVVFAMLANSSHLKGSDSNQWWLYERATRIGCDGSQEQPPEKVNKQWFY